MELQGKQVVLTGASGGIGCAMATALAAAGAELLLLGRDQVRLDQLARTLAGKHQTLAADLTTDEGRELVRILCEERWGQVDVLINNAGSSAFGLFGEQPEELIRMQVEINLIAPMLLCHVLVPLLLESSAGAIVNVGSAFGAIGYPGFSAYSASKFGLRGFSEALRRELADTPLRVFYLAPRATDTDLNTTPVQELNRELGNRVDHPDRVAQLLLRQLRRELPTVSAGRPERLFARLNALFPALIDGALRKQLPIIRRFAKS